MTLIRLSLVIFTFLLFGTTEAQIDSSSILKDFNIADNAWKDPELCLKLTKDVIPKLKLIKDYEKYAYALNTLSYCYNQMEQYDTLIQNNRFVLNEIESVLGYIHPEYTKAQNNLALAYKINGDFDGAKELYQKAIDKGRKNGNDINLLATSYMNLGNLYRNVGDHDLALNYFLSSEPLMEQFYKPKISEKDPSFQRLSSLYTLIGHTYSSINKNQKTGAYYKKALNVIAINPNIPQYHKNTIYLNLAEFYINNAEFQKALDLIKSISTSAKKINPSVESKIYKLKGMLISKGVEKGNSYEMFYNSYKSLPINKLSEKVDLLLSMFEANPTLFHDNKFEELNSLIQKLSYENKLISELRLNNIRIKLGISECKSISSFVFKNEKIIAEVIKGYSSNLSKYTFLQKAKNEYNVLIRLAYCKRLECNDKNKHLLYYLIENSKAIVYNLDKILLENESSDTELKNSRRSITLLLDKLSNSLDDKNPYLRTELLKKKEQYHKTHAKIYSSLDIETIPKVSELSKILIDLDASYTTYNVSDNEIFLYSINKDSSFVKKIELSPKKAYELLSKFNSGTSVIDEEIKEIQNSLFQNKQFENQIISLDSWLHFWPFSISISKNQNFSIRRIFSSKNFISKGEDIPYSKINYLSPTYTDKLKVNDKFIFSLDTEVTEHNEWFNNTEPNDVLHFSGHSTSYDSLTQSPLIYLKDSVIKISDLYDQRLLNQLFVLSSCDGQIGDQIVGEGVNNFNRSLSIIGAKSIVSTLWKVNAQSTSSILNSFYQNLILGQSKSFALTNAKQSFLTTCPDYQKHPYYWAGLVITGNDSPIIFNKKKSPIWIFSISLFLIICLFLIFMKLKF